MGKYMRKAKTTGDMAVMEGVRTRAKTLALQRRRLQLSTTAPLPSKSDSCYLQLRSRRLEKPMPKHQSSRKSRHSCGGCTGKQDPEGDCHGSGLISDSIEASKDLEIEGSCFGENNLDFEARGRSTRESTPCSLIRAADTISTPGSTTKRTCTNVANQRARTQNAPLINVPSTHELEDFFAHEELPQQPLFIEKYNFDFRNDLPLPGRYDWVRI
ncbi:hypothetical protein RD792_005521 [Penstemon davidsonii]|uniref:Cyclin-dependent kinase inhibitor n=1 Tax=Penstemon davidsonii TaxID=160366 RepID=A0ABR0DF19_9LAMI|nr:hypothetical protein RD792_005521 [Penstemon davidsonii]